MAHTRGDLKKHEKVVHGGTLVFPCDKCNYVGAKEKLLKTHKKMRHTSTVNQEVGSLTQRNMLFIVLSVDLGQNLSNKKTFFYYHFIIFILHFLITR